MTTTTTPTALKTIYIERAEGPASECRLCTFVTWAEAEAHVREAARTAPAGGGYDKCDVAIEWEGDRGYAFRLDLTRDHAAKTNPLRDELWREVTFWAGRHCPDHLTARDYHDLRVRFAKYAKATLADRDARLGALLDHCLWTDDDEVHNAA